MSLTPANTHADCECTVVAIEDVINNSDRIFDGRVTSARAVGSIVEFRVDVNETFNGNVPETIELQTPNLQHCGIPIYLNKYLIFFLKEGSETVDTCAGTSPPYRENQPNLLHALRLANYQGGSAQAFTDTITRAIYDALWEEEISELFDFVAELRPYGIQAERTAKGFIYRDLEIELTNGQFYQVHVLDP